MKLHRVTVLGAILSIMPFLVAAAAEQTWKAGVARIVVTPTNALWMAGYASRNHPCEGKETDLWAKALALEDSAGHRGVIVSLDVVGLKQPVYLGISKKAAERFNLKPEQLILCPSHTHCGPLLKGSSADTYDLPNAQRTMNEQYTDELEEKIVEVIGKAIADLVPAQMRAGQGTAGFAVNRRNNVEKEVPKLIASGGLKGPVDHSVPVMEVSGPDGSLKAVLFGYACHNTTMSFYKWCGDYAGFAETALENSHPGSTALFFMGCGADQNPLPRQQISLAQRYGNMLAAAVEEVLLTSRPALPPTLQTTIEMIDLRFGPRPTAQELEQRKADGNATIKRWATRISAQLEAGASFQESWPYPIQAWSFGGKQLLITLGGEPVVDYALRFKRQFGAGTWVAGYCNEVMTYIPSQRVMKEDIGKPAYPRWGYEGSHAFMAAGYPAFRWADDVEERVNTGVQRAVNRVSREQ